MKKLIIALLFSFSTKAEVVKIDNHEFYHIQKNDQHFIVPVALDIRIEKDQNDDYFCRKAEEYFFSVVKNWIDFECDAPPEKYKNFCENTKKDAYDLITKPTDLDESAMVNNSFPIIISKDIDKNSIISSAANLFHTTKGSIKLYIPNKKNLTLNENNTSLEMEDTFFDALIIISGYHEFPYIQNNKVHSSSRAYTCMMHKNQYVLELTGTYALQASIPVTKKEKEIMYSDYKQLSKSWNLLRGSQLSKLLKTIPFIKKKIDTDLYKKTGLNKLISIFPLLFTHSSEELRVNNYATPVSFSDSLNSYLTEEHLLEVYLSNKELN